MSFLILSSLPFLYFRMRQRDEKISRVERINELYDFLQTNAEEAHQARIELGELLSEEKEYCKEAIYAWRDYVPIYFYFSRRQADRYIRYYENQNIFSEIPDSLRDGLDILLNPKIQSGTRVSHSINLDKVSELLDQQIRKVTMITEEDWKANLLKLIEIGEERGYSFEDIKEKFEEATNTGEE